MYRSVIISFMLLVSVVFSKAQSGSGKDMRGINFVSPKFKCKLNGIDSIKAINANWIAICPFAFMYENSSRLDHNSSKNWWGDTRSGIIEQIMKARANSLKVFVKPHFWVLNKGWAGDFDLQGKVRIEWEANYGKYLLSLAKLCDSLNVEMLSIGTELKTYTTKHPGFFIMLVTEIRKVFQGKLTYAANWDEFESVSFWNLLDYIGVDAYFPLSEDKTPKVNDLENKWLYISSSLKKVSVKNNKKIIFCEYGYKSIDHAANKQWEFENTPKTENINLTAQVNAYGALYNSIWKENFIAGGFVWKWYNDYDMDKLNSDYTPQKKPVLFIIKKEYEKK